jgi:hypothetical protein
LLLLDQQCPVVLAFLVGLALSKRSGDPLRLFRRELDSPDNVCKQRRRDFLSHVA